ncbi:hypothetical protein GCM10017673_06040 [Streptosporangium violaceochromogenes]|nr:hypothetical protein GCM10017673_06040 [Streptosporangium violaceochromogenes]
MASGDEGFCGIDPDEMGRMAASLRGAADRLTVFGKDFEEKLRRYGIGTPALREISGIAEWAGPQVSMLHGRIDLVRNLGAGAPELEGAAAVPAKCTADPDGVGGGRGLVRLPDELERFGFAQGLARMYGQDILVGHSGDAQATLIHEHADEVARLADNPQAAAAFFALLPAKARDSLPGVLAVTGSKTAKQDLAAFSQALGAALRAPTLVPAFAKVRNDLTKPAPGKIVAWNRLALLAGAKAPTKARVAAARALALDDFMKNTRQDWRVGAIEARKYDLPPDLVAMALEVLAEDGEAVREAFAAMGGAEVKLSRVEKMKRFLDYAKDVGTGDEVADAFGRVLEAGSEATTEKPGEHSPAAAAFAFDVMVTTGFLGDAIPHTARESMAVIAGSYIHELASGSRFDKAVYRTSGFKIPENWTPLPGVTPAFYLSPADTYRFMCTFVGDKGINDDFDKVAARFRYDTLVTAAHSDKRKDEGYFELAATMLGDLAGLEFKATLGIRGERDATYALIRDIAKNTFSWGLDRIPLHEMLSEKFLAVTADVVNETWGLTKAYGVSRLLDDWAGSFETGVQEATGRRSDFVLRLKYDMAHLLHSAGYPVSDPPMELISKVTGGLKTYDELVAEARKETKGDEKWEKVLSKKLVAYERWMDSNKKLDIKLENSSRNQGSDTAKEQLRIWG